MKFPVMKLDENEYLFIRPTFGSSRVTGGALCSVEALTSGQGAEYFLWSDGEICDKSGSVFANREQLKFAGATRTPESLNVPESGWKIVDSSLYWRTNAEA